MACFCQALQNLARLDQSPPPRFGLRVARQIESQDVNLAHQSRLLVPGDPPAQRRVGRRPALVPVENRAVQRRERSEEHTSELQSQSNIVCRLLLEKKKKDTHTHISLAI